MIQIYTGVPGSGKSYKMVADLDKFLSENEHVNLVSNIRELRLGHLDFEEMVLERTGGAESGLTMPKRMEVFFDYDNQEALCKELQGPIMYVLDECQRYFPRRSSQPKTEDYFQRHRHLGHTVYLASQSSKLINLRLIPLIELEVAAARRTISFFGEFHYRLKSPQTAALIKSITVFRRQRIFGLYKSFDSAEVRKPQSRLLRRFVPVALLLAVMTPVFYNRVLNADARTERLTGKPVVKEQAGQGSKDLVAASEVGARPSAAATVPPRAAPPPVDEEKERMRRRLAEVEKKLATKERVFLDVIEMGDTRYTVDPETKAVVELTKIKRQVICVEGGLRCYYDRSSAEVVPHVGDRQGVSFGGSSNINNLPSLRPLTGPLGNVTPSRPGQSVSGNEGIGSFVSKGGFFEEEGAREK